MKLRNSCLLVLVTAYSALSACGGSQAAPEAAPPAAVAPPPAPAEPAKAPPPEAPKPEAAAPTPPPAEPVKPSINWDAMSHEERLEHMKTVVMPKMKELFASVDAKRYGDMKCGTCHGDGAKNQTFKMPNPKLPKLSFTDHFKKHMDKNPVVTKFMMEKVVPEMASLLGEPVFDPATKKGFGCAECHIVGP